MNYNTCKMFLVYHDEEGNRHLQPWEDLVDVGTLIDPETGDDMQIVGWEVPDTLLRDRLLEVAADLGPASGEYLKAMVELIAHACPCEDAEEFRRGVEEHLLNSWGKKAVYVVSSHNADTGHFDWFVKLSDASRQFERLAYSPYYVDSVLRLVAVEVPEVLDGEALTDYIDGAMLDDIEHTFEPILQVRACKDVHNTTEEEESDVSSGSDY